MTQNKATLLEQAQAELRCWIIYRARVAAGTAVTPLDEVLERQLNALVATYRAISDVFGLPATPDWLGCSGWPGELIRSVCSSRGVWPAFRDVVAQQHPDMPNPTPLQEGEIRLASLAERLVLRALRDLPGVSAVEAHPLLSSGSKHRADFLARAVSGRTAYVEVVMVGSDPAGDPEHLRPYRDRLVRKLDTYVELGRRPIVIWANHLAPPRLLAHRMNDVLNELGLPARPPQAPAWFEAGLAGGAA